MSCKKEDGRNGADQSLLRPSMGRKTGILALCLALLIGGGTAVWFWPKTKTWEVQEGEKPAANPLKGWVCWGENLSAGAGLSLAYVPVYWSEAEPEKGVYDFDGLEEKYHFREWREQGTRVILRVVLDSPSDEGEMNIPQWLYEEMGGDGAWYENDYGSGFSPNYENALLKQYHGKFIKALGERYNEDPQIAFIQLGSLGHWGEWHVHEESGIRQFPDSTVTDGYVRDYLEAFGKKKLLLRRPYGIVQEAGLGLYNDSFGDPAAQEEWLDWIQNGYISSQNGQELPGAPDFWKKAPSGGEFSTSHDMGWYFGENFHTTLRYLKESHTTFLGPNIPEKEDVTEERWENAEKFAQEMGYCFTVRSSRLKYQRGRDKRIEILFENIGTAPFYEDWEVRIALKDENGQTMWQQDFPAELSAWQKQENFSRTLEGTAGLEAEGLSVWVGIVDPMTGSCRVKMAMEGEEVEGMYCVGRF